jgi:hypothetical protein
MAKRSMLSLATAETSNARLMLNGVYAVFWDFRPDSTNAENKQATLRNHEKHTQKKHSNQCLFNAENEQATLNTER